MPTAAQYARYRADRTTIWVSKPAAAFLARERTGAQESVGAVLDRLLTELRRHRRAEGKTAAAPTKRARKSAPASSKRARKTGRRSA